MNLLKTLIESAIITSAVTAIAQPSLAQELSARDLGGVIEVNCQIQDEIPKLSLCEVNVFEESPFVSTDSDFYDPKELLNFMQDSSSAGFPAPQDRVEIFRIPIL